MLLLQKTSQLCDKDNSYLLIIRYIQRFGFMKSTPKTPLIKRVFGAYLGRLEEPKEVVEEASY